MDGEFPIHIFLRQFMSQCFVVLWIPTVNHIPLTFDKPNHNGVIKDNISDHPDSEKFMVKIIAKRRDIEIYIQSATDPDNYDYFLTLKFVDFSHNGMIKYTFTPRYLEGSEFCFDDKTFPEAVYHMIKSLYHTHEFHEKEIDSSLKPYLSRTDINIHEVDNDALCWYLTKYEAILRNLVKDARIVVGKAINQTKHQKDDDIRKRYESFLKMHIMALGYDAYVSSLYHSIYNKKCQLQHADKSLRRRAFNIENSVKYFNVLYRFFDAKVRVTNQYSILSKAEENLRNSEESLKRLEKNLDTATQNLDISRQSLQTSIQTLDKAQQNSEAVQNSAKESTKWAVYGIIFSFIVAIASLWYSIHSANKSSEQLESVLDAIEEIKDMIKANQTDKTDSHTLLFTPQNNR